MIDQHGAVVGSLTGAGVPERDAHFYAEGVRRRGTLVTARVDDARVSAARENLQCYKADDPAVRGAAYRETGWTSFDENAPAYTPDQVAAERARYIGGPLTSRVPCRSKGWRFLRNNGASTLTRGLRFPYDYPARPNIEEQSSNLVVTTHPTVARQLHELDRALAQVPEEQRQVILLVGLEGMSYEDAAAILHIPVGTVRSRLSRGRDALRMLMGMGERTVKPGPNSPLPKETAITAGVLAA
jgi:RNA polymerase sigma factor (sigma-70 family)